MFKSIITLFVLLSFSTFAQSSWKKIFYSTGIATGVGLAITSGAVSSQSDGGGSESGETDSGGSDSGQSDSGDSSGNGSDSDTQSNSQANYVQFEAEFFQYLNDYKMIAEQGKSISINDIKQPYVKQAIMNIMKDHDLVTKIEEEVDGTDLMDKINKVIANELLSK